MASNENLFHYDSTLAGRRIRLLYIEDQGSLRFHSSALSVKLVEESLDKADFDALSYVWGDQSTRVHINCNGKSVTIGQNLHAAIMEYRRRWRGGRGLWADAVCIDQNNETEKTEQVRMMRDIYEAAGCTIIWLGPLEAGDLAAIHLAQLAFDRCPEDLRYKMEGRHDFRLFESSKRGLPEAIRDGGSKGHEIDSTWKSLFHILQHPWFSRIWIIQELLVSEYAEMWRGGESINVDMFIWIADQIDTFSDLNVARQMVYPSEPSFSADGLALCYYQFNEGNMQPLWINMMATKSMKATEVLDRFFALVGISEELPADFINYSKTLQVVASQVGIMSLLGSPKSPMTDGLDLLADFPSRGLRHGNVKVSTWIPDCLSPPPTGIHMSLLYSTPRFRSTHKDFPSPEFRIDTNPGNSNNSPRLLTVSEFPYLYAKVPELLVKAATFDRIKETIPPTKPVNFKNDKSLDDRERFHQYSNSILRFISSARLLIDPRLSPRDDIMSGDMFEPFWRTLVYNRFGNSFVDDVKPDHTVGHSFAYWYMFWKLYQMRKWEHDTKLFYLHLGVLQGLMDQFVAIFDQAYGYRSFFVADSGRIGWAPPSSSSGDTIAIFQGSRIPFVAKFVEESGSWEYVGGCYVHGCMDGEIWQLGGAEWEFMRFK